MENHHVAQAMMLMRDPLYNFIPRASRKVWDTLRRHVIDMVLATGEHGPRQCADRAHVRAVQLVVCSLHTARN